MWEELHGPWQMFGPFTKAMDYFGDGSFWIIQAPGHMPGNLCAVVKLEDGEWILLGSDCCHSRYVFRNIAILEYNSDVFYQGAI
jgi:glyoxylase-like metal-dependent hydrolase (beta-lactamase superfamily II)